MQPLDETGASIYPQSYAQSPPEGQGVWVPGNNEDLIKVIQSTFQNIAFRRETLQREVTSYNQLIGVLTVGVASLQPLPTDQPKVEVKKISPSQTKTDESSKGFLNWVSENKWGILSLVAVGCMVTVAISAQAQNAKAVAKIYKKIQPLKISVEMKPERQVSSWDY